MCKKLFKNKRSARIYIKLIAVGISGEPGNDEGGVKKDLNCI